MGKNKKKDFLTTNHHRNSTIPQLAPWIRANVHNMPLSNLIFANRLLADLGYSERGYFDVFVPFLTERVHLLNSTDIQHVQDTYNKLKYSDDDLGGRHFFWA